MSAKKTQRAWVQTSRATKFSADEKTKVQEQVQKHVNNSDKLQKRVSRVSMRSNRVYLYELIEPYKPEGAVFIKPLIDDKYLEIPYARITLNNNAGTKCTLDWQRHNEQWVSLYEGTLQECLDSLDNDTAWFA